MTFEQRKERAITIMENKKMWSSNYAPPLLRILWRMGFKIPPLPFASFWQTAIPLGIWFGPTWGLLMWFFAWQNEGMQPVIAIISSAFAGIIFGVSMAAYHRWRKKVNNLPDWDSLE
ncbi:hypothetical protein Xsto_00023 [Xenorhabdus stockiae]|uniref:Uncharacterized protein n=1 Tax=Xenorhabdus stockiae TaxID=351614 RepID=A0A2D0KWB8_9GAMM|nr:DUF6404 family protein [Xenorhabdus stockiae]PHM67734.1 hypothetical protein Xsto_00023 [Xenorhabdus stockiae]